MLLYSNFCSLLSVWIFISLLDGVFGYGECGVYQYQCRSGQCIDRRYYCDRDRDCDDGSDEEFCSPQTGYRYIAPHFEYHQCNNGKMIPKIWLCDKINDCKDGADEIDCNLYLIHGLDFAVQNVSFWIANEGQKANALQSGYVLPRVAVLLFLLEEDYFMSGNNAGDHIKKELTIQLLGALLRNRTEVVHINELALYLQAMLATCINPHDFFGNNLVSIIRQHVNNQENYTNPFVLLTLCNAGAPMTERDVEKLASLIEETNRPSLTDIQAFTLMALMCIKNQNNGPEVKDEYIKKLESKLRRLQMENGVIESIYTTGLVVQALSGIRDSLTDNYCLNAIHYVMTTQKLDGSFGNILNTYSVVPILIAKNFLNVTFSHCTASSDSDTSLSLLLHERMQKRDGVRISISLNFSWDNEVNITLEFTSLANGTMLDAMKIAAATDENYRFESSDSKSHIFIYSISGKQNDPQNDVFWVLFKSRGTENELLNESLSNIWPQDGEHYTFMYKSSSWIKEP